MNIFIPENNNNPDFDYAYIGLPDSVVTEFFNIGSLDNLNNVDSIYISGYPGDKGNKQLWKKGDKKGM